MDDTILTIGCGGYFGGKAKMINELTLLMPDHKIYVEPFAGSAVVLLNKIRSSREILNDLDMAVSNLLNVIKDNPDALVRELEKYKYSERHFRKAEKLLENSESDVKRAGAEYMLIKTSFNNNRKQFSPTKSDAEKVLTEYSYSRIQEASKRLKWVEIHNENALMIIDEYKDCEDVFLYLDPPYMERYRTAKKVYRKEMPDTEQSKMLESIANAKAKILLSGYRAQQDEEDKDIEFYDDILSRDERWKCYMLGEYHKSSSGRSGSIGNEFVWCNYDISSLTGATGAISEFDYMSKTRKLKLSNIN